MRSAFSLLAQHSSQQSPVTLPSSLFIASAISAAATPPAHSLLIASASWALACAYGISKVGVGVQRDSNTGRRRLCWAAGTLLALAHVCERAAGDRDGLTWTKFLLPLTIFVILQGDPFESVTEGRHLDSSAGQERAATNGSIHLLAIITVSAAIALGHRFTTAPIVALGLCDVLLTATGLILLQKALASASDDGNSGGFMSANGSFSQRADATVTEEDKHLASLRDASLVTAVACSCATLAFEGLWTRDLAPGSDFIHSMGAGSNVGLQHWGYGFGMLLLIGNGAVKNILLVSTIRRQGPLRLGFIALAAGLLSRLTTQFSQIWFTLLCTATSYLFLSDENTTAVPSAFGLGKRMRARHLITVVAIVSFAAITITYLRRPIYETGRDGSHLVYEIGPPAEAFAPLELANNQAHPVDQLIRDGETRFSALLARQSQTLEEAVTEYRRRYKIQPPPNFDRWYEFAKRKGVQLIDEYDNIHHSLLPFWALEPATIRGRVREALGFGDNNLMGLLIRAGGVTKIENGQEWLQQAVLGMIEDFVQFLPDMDLAFNIHDEPRVVVPHDELSRMVSTAKDVRIPLAFANSYPTNAFSARPRDVNDGKRIDEVKTTRFNVFAHQPTWTHSRLSCSPNSQARSLEDNAVDNATSYALGELGFIYNHTAFSDICNSPSLSSTYGFFDRPNSFNVVHDLVPIFSQSKISSFQDILYPSPWYWYGKVAYDEKRDVDWQKKQGKLWWRGSTTGGFSRNGGWRRQHRQQFVRKINDPYKVKILANTGEEEAPHWQPKEVRRADYRDIVDVHFSHVGQCDPGDCDAQREFFDIVKPADQQDAWKYRYLLDIDGNAFSGRFYAFLESKSLVYKMAIFREWHEEWIKPWVHYIPLSMRGDEWLESVRYFSGEEEGKIQAPRMAEQGRQWARKVLRNEDLEVWFFRLLLEYGRVVDDNRKTIGYSGP